MPRSLRSSAVRFGNSAAVMAFSRNAASYCSSPRLFSHSPTSTAVSFGLVMFAADYCAGVRLLSRQRDAVEVSRFRPTAGEQICPGHQQWIVMIDAERGAGTAGVGKALLHLPNSRKAGGCPAFVVSMGLVSATGAM